MSFRYIDLKNRTVRRVFHRCLIVISVAILPILWLVLAIVFKPGGVRVRGRTYYDTFEAFGVALSYMIAFYVFARLLYWGIYWILQAFEPKPTERYDEDD